MTKVIFAAVLLSACFPTRSEKYRCEVESDCAAGRTCDHGYCVIDPVDGGLTLDGGIDAAIDAPPDATMTMSFAVGNECNGSKCKGGYNGAIDTTGGANTANKVCTQHGYARSTTFTFSNNKPGGSFCSWNPATMQWNCDPGCSGCNPMNNVTCSTP